MISSNSPQLKVNPLGEEGVGQTCLLIAAWRARESERIDPLFIDPIANIFVPTDLEPWVEQVTQASVSTQHLISCRTKYFDDYLASEMRRGVTQVVLLGAGLDTRAIRLGNESVVFYEIDHRDVLAYKERLLKRHGYAQRSCFIPGDYICDDLFALLAEQGFDSQAETYFIWEGNTLYIPVDALINFLKVLKRRVPRFRISFDYLSEELIQRKTGFQGAKNLLNSFEGMGAPWITGFEDIQNLAKQVGLIVCENKWMVEVVPSSRLRVALSPDIFRHYSVCTMSSHE